MTPTVITAQTYFFETGSFCVSRSTVKTDNSGEATFRSDREQKHWRHPQAHGRLTSFSNRLRPSFTLVQSDPSVLAGSWTGHTDAVWGLAYSGIKNLLLSCSADGTVKLWNPTEKSPCISTFNTNRGENREHRLQEGAGTSYQSNLNLVFFFFIIKEYGIPTSVDFNGCDPAHMVVSFNSGDVVVYDLETAQNILVLKGQGEGSEACTHTHAHTCADPVRIVSPLLSSVSISSHQQGCEPSHAARHHHSS